MWNRLCYWFRGRGLDGHGVLLNDIQDEYQTMDRSVVLNLCEYEQLQPVWGVANFALRHACPRYDKGRRVTFQKHEEKGCKKMFLSFSSHISQLYAIQRNYMQCIVTLYVCCKKYWLEHTWGVGLMVEHEMGVFCRKFEKLQKIMLYETIYTPKQHHLHRMRFTCHIHTFLQLFKASWQVFTNTRPNLRVKTKQ